ncbi:MAG: CoA transferase subunit A [Chloroflexota bacterium]
MNKVVANVEEAIADIPDGAMIAIPGFFTAGVPRILLRALIAKGTKDLTLACGCGPLLGATEELELLCKNKQVKRVIDSYALFRSASKGLEHCFEQAVRKNEIELEIYPMGTLAEKYRAAGAGIPAFYTPTGVGTFAEEDICNVHNGGKKEKKIINGREYLLEYALKPDFAFIHANQGDQVGNLRYRRTSLNFNHVMAMAAKITIAEVEELVEPGLLIPEDIHTPGIYVKRIVPVPRLKVKIGID